MNASGLNAHFFPISRRTTAVEAMAADQVGLVLTGPAATVVFHARFLGLVGADLKLDAEATALTDVMSTSWRVDTRRLLGRRAGGEMSEAAKTARTLRQKWMAVLARASRADIATHLGTVSPLPNYEIMAPPCVGTVMVEGRAGGTGQRFNLGEATVTKVVVRLDDGTMGFAYALGRDTRKALLCAVLDGALQDVSRHDELMHAVIQPLARAQHERRLAASCRAAATKVEFFTLQRGDG